MWLDKAQPPSQGCSKPRDQIYKDLTSQVGSDGTRIGHIELRIEYLKVRGLENEGRVACPSTLATSRCSYCEIGKLAGSTSFPRRTHHDSWHRNSPFCGGESVVINGLIACY